MPKLQERKPKIIGEKKVPKQYKYPQFAPRIKAIHIDFIYSEVEKSKGSVPKKSFALRFAEVFIESHPNFSKFKKANSKDYELDNE